MDGRHRAARAVAARRGELGMTQQQLADAAGVDLKTIGSLERRGRWSIARNRARIEKALGWPVGEMERIASDDEPELAAEDDWEAAILADPNLPDGEKREIILRSRRVRAELYPELALRRPPAPQAPAERESGSG